MKISQKCLTATEMNQSQARQKRQFIHNCNNTFRFFFFYFVSFLS